MLDFDVIEWDDEDDLRGNVEHIAAAGLTPAEVEAVLRSADPDTGTSDSSGRPVIFGTTGSGKYILVIYTRSEENGVAVVRPVTAYEVGPPS